MGCAPWTTPRWQGLESKGGGADPAVPDDHEEGVDVRVNGSNIEFDQLYLAASVVSRRLAWPVVTFVKTSYTTPPTSKTLHGTSVSIVIRAVAQPQCGKVPVNAVDAVVLPEPVEKPNQPLC